jgi:hypothetical protein
MAAAQFALAMQRLRARVASSPLIASAVQTIQLLAPDYHSASAAYNRFTQIITPRDDAMPPLWPMLQPIGMSGPMCLPSENSATDDAEETTKEEWEEGTWFAVPKRKVCATMITKLGVPAVVTDSLVFFADFVQAKTHASDEPSVPKYRYPG